MGDSYEKVKENEAVHALHERAKMIVEMELQHPSWHTFHEFMHVAEAADEDSKPAPEWEGITGRVKQLLEPTNAKMVEMAGRMDELTGKVDGTRDELKEVRQLLQLLLERM